MKKVSVLFIDKDEWVSVLERSMADTILEFTDVPGIFRILKYRNRVNPPEYIQIKDL